jgi:hypothetical protein
VAYRQSEPARRPCRTEAHIARLAAVSEKTAVNVTLREYAKPIRDCASRLALAAALSLALTASAALPATAPTASDDWACALARQVCQVP